MITIELKSWITRRNIAKNDFNGDHAIYNLLIAWFLEEIFKYSGAETMTTSLSTSPIQELEITLPNSDQVMSGNVLGL